MRITRRQATACLLFHWARASAQPQRPRVREFGLRLGTLLTGPLNAITDVDGVRVGHATVIAGERVRTGITVVLPHGGNLFREKVPGAVFIGNAFGKLMGSTQVNELGEIESPICLTSTLNVPRVADAVLDYMLGLPGNENVRSFNALVGETNDGGLNDIRSRPVTREHVLAAIRGAKGGAVEEGSVGAGTGTIAFGYKGGIGTASRKTPQGHTVGVLVQSNFGGDLLIAGVPVGRALRREGADAAGADGSIILVVATDAPLEHRNLRRLGLRAIMGLARTGAAGSNGSGDYAIAFSTKRGVPPMANDDISPLFLAAIEAAEEAILNSLFRATAVTGNGRTVDALPLERVRTILRDYRALP